MPPCWRTALAAVCAAAAVLQCAAFQQLPVAPARRAALACGRGRCPARMAQAPPPAAAGDDFEGEDEQAPRPKINWSDRFKRALDMNPGRTERLSRTEQELRYQQVLTANPKDVDALCGYACFLSTVKVRMRALPGVWPIVHSATGGGCISLCTSLGTHHAPAVRTGPSTRSTARLHRPTNKPQEDYVGASELYSTAVKTDPARARRITVQVALQRHAALTLALRSAAASFPACCADDHPSAVGE